VAERAATADGHRGRGSRRVDEDRRRARGGRRDALTTRAELIRAYRRHSGLANAFVYEVSGTFAERDAEGARVFDERGEAYLDFAGGFGIFALGHGCRAVRDAVIAELDEPDAALEDRARAAVDAVLPPSMRTVVFSGSGSTAMDAALELCLAAGKTRVVTATGGFHGSTLATLAVSGSPRRRRLGRRPLSPAASLVPYGNASALARVVGPDTCVVLEPVQGETLHVPPSGYLAEVRTACFDAGAWLVADETSTGFGRTGAMWGCDHDGVVPDLLVYSKAATGGYAPFAGLAVREGLAEVEWDRDACPRLGLAAAAAAIDVIVGKQLVARAAGVGSRLAVALAELAGLFPRLVTEARGRGLFCGLALRDVAVHHALWLELVKRRLLVAPAPNPADTPVLRLLPPFTVHEAELDEALETMHAALARLNRRPDAVYRVASAAIRGGRLAPSTFDLALRVLARFV
jgi:putrescine aminotransferase